VGDAPFRAIDPAMKKIRDENIPQATSGPPMPVEAN
jgi:hypothetical protein